MRMPVRRTARFLAALALCGAAGAQAETIATGMVAAANPWRPPPDSTPSSVAAAWWMPPSPCRWS
ncbi:hypothetical protein WJ969_18430 [Achromobacter xylosoxidans]